MKIVSEFCFRRVFSPLIGPKFAIHRLSAILASFGLPANVVGYTKDEIELGGEPLTCRNKQRLFSVYKFINFRQGAIANMARLIRSSLITILDFQNDLNTLLKRNMYYSLYLPQQGKPDLHGKSILAADIGGTKTSLGLFEVGRDTLSLLQEATFPSKGQHTFEEIVTKFLDGNPGTPSILSIGVAGPVSNNQVQLTNLDWELNGSHLQRDLGIDRVVLINDLEATAYGLAGLVQDDVASVFDHEKTTLGNMTILAPGTGLGEAGLFWDGEAYRPFATEGGHSDFAPQTALDLELHTHLKDEIENLSWEHVVSGPGIHRIYRFFRDVKEHKEPAWLAENFKNDSDPAAVISHAAMRELDPTCIKTMELFVSYMAREATSLVLKHKATGGLLLGGGIPPRIYPLLRKPLFRQQFVRNSQMTELLEKVPIQVILNSKAALIGAAYYGAYGHY